ncbi:MAG: hypothetical protein ABIR18_01465 [Chitinophagaceae bacterium]
MKKHSSLPIIIILLTVLSFTACKKEDNRDFNALMKNTVWTGEFNYTGHDVQSVSMEFKDNGQVWWYEMTKEYGGTWVIENKRLKVVFGNNTGFDAEISKDNKLNKIQNISANGWNLVSAELNTTPDIPLLFTTWSAPGINLSFKPGNMVDMDNGNGTTWILQYTHKPKGLSFSSAQWKMFMVFRSGTVLKGANKLDNEPGIHPFEVTKK